MGPAEISQAVGRGYSEYRSLPAFGGTKYRIENTELEMQDSGFCGLFQFSLSDFGVKLILREFV